MILTHESGAQEDQFDGKKRRPKISWYYPFKGADGQPIPSWGCISKTVQFQGKHFTAKFLQAAVAGPILGIDFL
jgi:hypothetical protein